MRRTKILMRILILLILSMLTYYLANNYDDVSNKIIKIYKKYYNPKKIIIPEKSYYHRGYLFTSVSETDNFMPKNKEDIKKIYYTVLNNGWDSFTFYCDEEYVTCIDDIKSIADSNEEEFISFINNYVSPYNSYIKYNTRILNDNEVTLTIDKLYTEEEIQKLENIIDTFIAKNNINTSSPTKRDIEKIHDYVINITTYDKNYVKNGTITDSSKATGALINGVAICSGYTDAFALFLDKLKIPNFKVTSEEHEWNVVYFNKKWSHIDVTWDDDEINKNNNRNFFLISTTELQKKDKKDHNFSKDLFNEIK